MNKVREVFFTVLLAVAFFMAASFFEGELNVGSYTLKQPKLLDEITAKGKISKAPSTAKTLSDSLILKIDSLIAQRNIDPENIIEFSNDTTGGMCKFFEALNQTKQKKKKTRIAYFGDSMIEGDLITQDLRKLLQQNFGGSGVGFVPVTSIVAGFRVTINHAFSPNWHIYNLLDPVSEKHTLGISGYVFEPSYFVANIDTGNLNNINGSWVKYAAVKQPRLNKFDNIKLYYGNSTGNNYICCNKVNAKLEGNDVVNQLTLNQHGSQNISANFICQSPVNIYGFSFESDSGVLVDNFSFRGNSGMPLTKIPHNVLTGLNKYLNYDLVVLHYGVNVVNSKTTDYTFYEKGMTEVVKHFQSCFPNASILVVSTGDKSIRKNGQYITDPSVPIVVAAQRRVAEKTNTAFWNLYESMGGENSMVKWAQGDTIYANKDYTHFNFRGAKRVAEMFYKNISDKYEEYNKKKVRMSLKAQV